MIQGLTSRNDSYCAIYRLYIFYFTKVLGIDFKIYFILYCCCEIILSNDTLTMTFSLKQMTFRKISTDNSVKYIPLSGQTTESYGKPNKHDEGYLTSS